MTDQDMSCGMSSTGSSPPAATAWRDTPAVSLWALASGLESAAQGWPSASPCTRWSLEPCWSARGVIYFISESQWLMLGLMALIEAVFVFAFIRLVRQARNRRSAS